MNEPFLISSKLDGWVEENPTFGTLLAFGAAIPPILRRARPPKWLKTADFADFPTALASRQCCDGRVGETACQAKENPCWQIRSHLTW